MAHKQSPDQVYLSCRLLATTYERHINVLCASHRGNQTQVHNATLACSYIKMGRGEDIVTQDYPYAWHKGSDLSIQEFLTKARRTTML